LSRVCQAVLAGNLAGLYHAGGPRPLSLYQIAQIVNRVGGYEPAHLMGCPRIKAGPIPPRAGNVTMDSSRLAAALGFAPFDPWPFYEDFVPTHADWHRERPAGEGGSLGLLRDVLYRNPGLG
jgi:dTDP-4-dehydrorhamnose reductase